MSTASSSSGSSYPEQAMFMKWQCRVRQTIMRERVGRPDDGISPYVFLDDESSPSAQVITLIAKKAAFSQLPEMIHMARKTFDPGQRHDSAVQFFSSSYYQKASEFSDILSAVFLPESPNVERILAASRCTLAFRGYGHEFNVSCKPKLLKQKDYFHQASWWHNALFNPNLPEDAPVIAFIPIWPTQTN